jgi:1-aminocyclopropane-1-carboxylate deaminase
LHKFWYKKKVANIDMLRLDKLHPVVSGNKWFKLRLNLLHAVDHGYKTIRTFGGGHSNHLIAAAYAARPNGLHAIGIVRGRYDALTPTLEACVAEGMQLIFVTNDDYKNKENDDWIRLLTADFDRTLIIPEGGANERGRTGAGLINRYIKRSYTHILVSVGSGTTLIGLRDKLNTEQHIMGFAPMKGGTYLNDYISEHLQPGQNKNWTLTDDWHMGGFGKSSGELIDFMNAFYEENKIPLDVVYTGKMMYGLHKMLEDNLFSSCDNLLCIHTGGLQGNATIQDKLIY